MHNRQGERISERSADYLTVVNGDLSRILCEKFEIFAVIFVGTDNLKIAPGFKK